MVTITFPVYHTFNLLVKPQLQYDRQSLHLVCSLQIVVQPIQRGTMPTTYTTKQTANILQVAPNTLRNWSDQYADYLSESARPGAQPERRFTDKDLTVLTYIKQLRSEGMKEDGIKSRLSETSFNDVEILQPATTTLQSEPATALPTVQEEHHNAPALLMVMNDLEKRIDAKIAALERSREPSFTVGIGIGFIAALLFVLVIVGIAVLYGGFR